MAKQKETAVLHFTEHKTVMDSKDNICQELEFHGYASFSHYEATYKGDHVKVTDKKTNVTIKMSFEDFEYSFLFGETVCGEVTKNR